MPFKFTKLPIEGAFIIEPHVYIDERGVYKKVFCADDYLKLGISSLYEETSDIISSKGSIRGLHSQRVNPQSKLIHVIRGKLYDAFVDLRENSSTYLKHFEIELNAEDGLVLFVPAGCAHGFMALEDNTIFSYQCSSKYDPDSSFGIRWDDEDLNIRWPLKNDLIITEKDKKWPTLKEYLGSN